MTKPVRLQLSRRKGFNLQAHSRSVNGLPAVNVARPSKWGNHYVVGQDGTAAECVAMYREFHSDAFGRMTAREDLNGFNLACWCAPGAPCHADVLLEIANSPRCEAIS